MKSNYAKLVNGVVVPLENSHEAMLEWSSRFESRERYIAKHTIDGVFVSTVFLGLNHGFGETDLWFETMIFGGPHDGYQERYETLDEAKAGHADALELVNSPAATP